MLRRSLATWIRFLCAFRWPRAAAVQVWSLCSSELRRVSARPRDFLAASDLVSRHQAASPCGKHSAPYNRSAADQRAVGPRTLFAQFVAPEQNSGALLGHRGMCSPRQRRESQHEPWEKKMSLLSDVNGVHARPWQKKGKCFRSHFGSSQAGPLQIVEVRF